MDDTAASPPRCYECGSLLPDWKPFVLRNDRAETAGFFEIPRTVVSERVVSVRICPRCGRREER
jgi:hypothetical protein